MWQNCTYKKFNYFFFFFSELLAFKTKIICSGENPEMPKIVVGGTHTMAETFGCIIEVHKDKLNEW